MRAYLVRHAKAVKRPRWDGPDDLRPLSDEGWSQALALEKALRGAPLARILSSPHLRCRQTLQPLGGARGLPVVDDERLAEGSGPRGALALLRDCARWPTLFCSHGDLIPALLGRLAREHDFALEERPCEKGSIWLLEGRRRFSRATYRPPLPEPERSRPRRKAPAPLHELPARIAVLDLGSTSFHLQVSDAISGGELKRVLRERVMLRLGASIGRSARIPDEVCALAVESARALRERAEEARAECLLPVGTSALRDASNGRELASEIGEALDVPVRVLSGREEARLIFAAFRKRLGLRRGQVFGADLGGGSLELMVGDGRELAFEATLPLGVARLHGELVSDDPLGPTVVAAIRDRVDRELAAHEGDLESVDALRCVVTGGTMGALARLIEASESGSTRPAPGRVITHEEIELLSERLIATTHEERLAMTGIAARRADLLPTGAVIWSRLARRLGVGGFELSDWGLREGVMLEALGSARPSAERER